MAIQDSTRGHHWVHGMVGPMSAGVRRGLLPVVAWGVLLAWWSLSPAAAGQSAEEITRKMDHAMTHAKDQFFEYDMIIQKPGEKEQRLVFQVTIKGKKKRRIEFVEPGDVKGMRFLVLSTTQMYVYLPAYRKVRRVASHVRDQGFMGSAYSQEDMSITMYGEYMTPKLLGEDDKTWTLEMTRKPDADFPYPKLILKVDKKMYQPVEIKYMNDDGKVIKTETRVDFECKQDVCNPKVMKMVDHRRNDVITYLKRRKWKLNTGVSDRFFTVRALQRNR